MSLYGFFLSTARCILEVSASLSLVFLFCSLARVYHHSLLDSVNVAVASCLRNNCNIHQSAGCSGHMGDCCLKRLKKFLRSQCKMLTLFIEKCCFGFHVRPSNKWGNESVPINRPKGEAQLLAFTQEHVMGPSLPWPHCSERESVRKGCSRRKSGNVSSGSLTSASIAGRTQEDVQRGARSQSL